MTFADQSLADQTLTAETDAAPARRRFRLCQ